jgi:hypothetical protein
MTHTEVIEGIVESVNERGVRVNGEWFNVSRFKPIALPQQGQRVQLGVDTKGFIMEVVYLDQAATPAVPSGNPERITRLAVLQVAAAFGASRAECKSSDVLRIADAWLEWVNQ